MRWGWYLPPDAAADEDLVRAFQAGDTRSFDALFQRYQRPTFNYIYRMIGSLGPSEELTQDAFLRVFTSLGRAGEVANFRAWLYRIATNAAISYLRKGKQRVSSLEERLADNPQAEPAADRRYDPEEQQLRREAVDQAVLALQRLSEAHRQVLVLRQMQGLSYQELAVVMGLSAEAVTSLLHRARQEFRLQVENVERGTAAAERAKQGERS